MPYTNVHRGARISPLKVRPIMNMIRGKSFEDAQAMLEMSTLRGAVLVRRALLAAAANAQEVGELGTQQMRQLKVVDARVDSGPTIKRWQPKDRGRAHPILKRTSHITVAVDLQPNA